jgi:hypothetical protein
MNKYQIQANKKKLDLIASGELKNIADKAISDARKDSVEGDSIIDVSEMVNSHNSLERHIGNQMHGSKIPWKISAKNTLDFAAREIFKMGTIDKKTVTEALIELENINNVINELELTDI